jgi:hypothetical protein
MTIGWTWVVPSVVMPILTMRDASTHRPQPCRCPIGDCGTGGFLLEAYRHATQGSLTAEDRERLRTGFVRGIELVDGTARLAAMNMVLHVIVQPGDQSPIEVRDALLRGRPAPDGGVGQPALRPQELDHDGRGRRPRGARGR